MAKVLGKMKKVGVDDEPVKEEKKILKCLQGFDTSHIVDESKNITVEININDIKEKEKNNFIKSNIEQLGSSIKEIGLQQPIVVKKVEKDEKGNQQYEVIAGHRRLAAYRILCKEIGKTQFPEDNPYLKIQARVVDSNDNEDKIYLQTNTNTRNTTIYEAILNCDLDEIDFENNEFKDKYNKIVYPEGIISNKEKYDNNSIIKYLEIIIKENFPNLEDTKTDTIRKYYYLIRSSCHLLTEKILKGEITTNQARAIVKYGKKDQPAVIENLLSGKPIDKDKKIDFKITVVNKEDRDYYKEMLKVDGRLKTFVDINLNDFNTDDWTANSKAYLKQMNKVLSEIKKLESMPKK